MVLAVHGTRDPAGVRVAEAIVRQVRRAGVPVRIGHADVRRPSVADVVQPGCVVVPAFLSAGYHVRTDLPAQLAGSGAILTPHLGTSLVPAAHDRLLAVGYQPGDTLVLAAAGSSDDRALAEVHQAADLLGELCRRPVAIGYVAGTAPKLAELVAQVREPGRRVAVAAWLLAPGLFHTRAQDSGADLVADPIGDHPTLVAEVLARYRAACDHLTVVENGRIVRASRKVAADPAALFELIADPAKQPSWDGNDNLAAADAEQRVRQVGDVFTMSLTAGSVRENHVVEFVEGRCIAWRPAEPGKPPPGHLWRWELEPLADGRTVVTHTYDWTDLTDEHRLVRAKATTADRLQASVDRLAACVEDPPGDA